MAEQLLFSLVDDHTLKQGSLTYWDMYIEFGKGYMQALFRSMVVSRSLNRSNNVGWNGIAFSQHNYNVAYHDMDYGEANHNVASYARLNVRYISNYLLRVFGYDMYQLALTPRDGAMHDENIIRSLGRMNASTDKIIQYRIELATRGIKLICDNRNETDHETPYRYITLALGIPADHLEQAMGDHDIRSSIHWGLEYTPSVDITRWQTLDQYLAQRQPNHTRR